MTDYRDPLDYRKELRELYDLRLSSNTKGTI